jgi:hypothetical protein
VPMTKSPLFWFILFMTALATFAAISPAEKTLGANAHIVYLHGVWVWAALASMSLAGLIGLAGLLSRRQALHCWSRALGRTGLFFWITYLPLSMWAMQTSWNGLFLAEPRWRLAITFAIAGLLLQLGLTLMEDPAWASAANLVYISVLVPVLLNTQNVMHPPSPILNSNAPRIQFYFAGLFLLALLAVWQGARWWLQLECQTDGSHHNNRMASPHTGMSH